MSGGGVTTSARRTSCPAFATSRATAWPALPAAPVIRTFTTHLDDSRRRIQGDAAGRVGHGAPSAKPAIVVVAPDGNEVYRYVGVDFMDRPGDEEVLAALDGLGLPPIDASLEPVPHLPPVPGPRAVQLSDLGAYMRGVRFAMQAMAARARDAWDLAEAERTGKMAERYVAAQGATRRVTADRVASGSGAAP